MALCGVVWLVLIVQFVVCSSALTSFYFSLEHIQTDPGHAAKRFNMSRSGAQLFACLVTRLHCSLNSSS